ncbi:MAG: hypothetical protein LLF76_07870 [Planctomycetaceae bacterium]|nr:hypothetical protein [Planctomycetaceae bacterium]
MRQMYLLGLFLMVLGMFMTGCKAPGLTKKQVDMRHRETIQQNMLQFQDDIDSVFLFDRPSRMSPMYVR